MSDDEWDDVIDTNLRGAFLFTRAASQVMMRHATAAIINISSVSGLIGNPGQANYSASKAGLIGFTQTVARELAKRKITVNADLPRLHRDRDDRRPRRPGDGEAKKRSPPTPRRSPRNRRRRAVSSQRSAGYITGRRLWWMAGWLLKRGRESLFSPEMT